MLIDFSHTRHLSLDQPCIMGILNVTPDSFSDGGSYLSPDDALQRGLAMVEEGADLIDVGGESTRPGSQPVPAEEQIKRVVPVIRALAVELQKRDQFVPISIDTQLPIVATAALEAGASIINDVNAGQAPGMLELAARHHVPIVLMHMQGNPATMQHAPHYHHVVDEVKEFLQSRIEAALAAGVAREKIVIDPGIGFGKTVEHNLQLLAHLDEFTAMGLPVLLGVSRKRFLGTLGHMGLRGKPPQPGELTAASCAAAVSALVQEVRLFRVHDVSAHRQALDTAWAILKARHSDQGRQS